MNKHVLTRWPEHPYQSYDKRYWTVEHRILVKHIEGVGADVRHEVRSSDDPSVPSEWSEREAVELRSHGMRVIGGDSD